MTSVRPKAAFAAVAYAVREATEALATREVCDAILARALAEAQLADIPESGPVVLEFADGPLHRALTAQLGEASADEVLGLVRPLLVRASDVGPRAIGAIRLTSVSARKGPSPSAPPPPMQPPVQPIAAPPPMEPSVALPVPAFEPYDDEGESGVHLTQRFDTVAAPSVAPFVFFASRDPQAVAELTSHLSGRAVVRPVDGLLELLEAIDEELEGARAVIFDALWPPLQLRSLVTVAPELAGRVGVVVWRAPPEARVVLEAAAAATEAWHRQAASDVALLADYCLERVSLAR